jgi:hypothetical protein
MHGRMKKIPERRTAGDERELQAIRTWSTSTAGEKTPEAEDDGSFILLYNLKIRGDLDSRNHSFSP